VIQPPLGLGNTQYQAGDRQAAERSYRRATEADPAYLAAWNNLAEVLAQRGCFHAALATLDGALGRPGGDASLRARLEQTRAEIRTRRPAGDRTDAAVCGQTN
jgi:tetratricopeptide (TPR) repeat protein